LLSSRKEVVATGVVAEISEAMADPEVRHLGVFGYFLAIFGHVFEKWSGGLIPVHF
jgi:hypothetical protein